MRFGAHCVLYGAEVASDPEAVLGRLARAGAEGCEIGQRFFGTDNRERLMKALEENHVEMSGMHCNGLYLADLLHNPEKSEAALVGTAKFVEPMKNKNVIATGCVEMEKIKDRPIGAGVPEEELHDPKKVKEMAVTLNGIVKKIKDTYGVQVHYHNHSWEFADNGLIFHSLMEYAPDLKFALDTAGPQSQAFLRRSCFVPIRTGSLMYTSGIIKRQSRPEARSFLRYTGGMWIWEPGIWTMHS